MPPDPHEMLYQKLTEITDRVSQALKEADPDVLMRLAEEQDTLVKALLQAGNRTDSRLQALNRRVSDVITEIRQCQQEISIRIKQAADGRKLVHAYVT